MRTVKLLLFLLMLPVSVALAQTGKIAGAVTDSGTGEALFGVNVIIEGTAIGATTDANGFYTILNVRPGTYSVRASYIGYASQIVQDVRVNIDLTTTLDFSMREEVVQGEEIVVTAQAPIIQRDIAASQRNIDGEEIAQGRYQNVSNVLTASVSVNNVSQYDDTPSIRGSGFDESLFFVDGVNQGDALTNQARYKVNLDAVEEIKIQTGGFNAEYGNVRSGVINVVTKEGGERYSGSINAQYSAPALKNFGPDMFGHESPVSIPFVDPASGAFSGNEFFDGWDNVAAGLASGEAHAGAAQELYARWLWRHRSQDSIDELKKLESQGLVTFADGVDPDDMVWHQQGQRPDYRVSATLGGPVPFLSPVKFFLSFDASQVEYMHRFPDPTFNDYGIRGKLTTNLGTGIKLMAHGFYQYEEGGQGGQGPGVGGFVSSNPFTSTDAENKYWYPHCAVPGNRIRQIYGAKLTHAINPTTFYEMNLTYDRVDYAMDMSIRNTAPVPGTCRDLDGDGVAESCMNSSSKTSGSGIDGGRIGTEAEANARAAAGQEGWENWRDWALIRIGDHWYDEAPKGYGPVNWRDITGEYRMESCNTRLDETNTYGIDFSGAITSQINQSNQIKAGVWVRQDYLDAFYDQDDPSVNGGTMFDYNADPWRGAVYVQDKLEYRGFVANIGLRYDWHLTGEAVAVLDGCSLEFPSMDCGDKPVDDGPWSQYLLAGNTTTDVEGGRIRGVKEVAILDNMATSRFFQGKISPRIGVSHPITTVAKIFFNYGHFWQWPNMINQYEVEMNPRNGYRINDFGNPLLEPLRTIQYEVGYEQNLLNKMNLRVTGYYKDINNETSDGDFYPLGYGGSSYDMWINMGFQDTRGVEFFTELRRGVLPYVSGWLSANWLVSSGAEYGYEDWFENPSSQAGLGSTQVGKPDVRPIVKANLNFRTPEDFMDLNFGGFSPLGGWNLNVLYTWQRGRHDTWNPANFPLVEYNIRWRPYQRWDLRLTKSLFSAGTFDAQFYLDISNLFNNRNMTPRNADSPEITDQNWAWDGHRWWNNQYRNYLESLGYSAENQNEDGSFNNTSGNVGDWSDCDKSKDSGCEIDMPDFSPFTFLGRRDIYFGIKLYF